MVTHNSKLAKNEASWASVDQTALPEDAFVSARTFPHHWVRNGVLYLHRGALELAWAEANTVNALPVLAHLRRHFAAIGLKKLTLAGVTYDLTEFDTSLVAAGLLAPRDLEIDLGAMALRVTGGE